MKYAPVTVKINKTTTLVAKVRAFLVGISPFETVNFPAQTCRRHRLTALTRKCLTFSRFLFNRTCLPKCNGREKVKNVDSTASNGTRNKEPCMSIHAKAEDKYLGITTDNNLDCRPKLANSARNSAQPYT